MVPTIMKSLFLSLLCLFVLLNGCVASEADAIPDHEVDVTECEFYDETECQNGDCPKVKQCKGSPKAYCFATWQNGTKGIEVTMKGCWSTNENCFNQTKCIQSIAIKKTNFCCCMGKLCNKEFFHSDEQPTTTLPTVTEKTTERKKLSSDQLVRTLVYSIVPIVGLAAVIVLVFWMWKRFRQQIYEYHEQLPTVDPALSIPPSPHPPRPLKLIELHARGRYGAVWKAQLMDETVAVKTFPLQDQQSWRTEQDIYRLPHMNHKNILNFIATERRGDNLNIELWLITEFHSNGSLCDYLKGNTITWSELCKMAETMAAGLSFLHDEIPASRGKEAKPAVAHRDFKSKNVLIKSDLSACIADFGLALKFEPGKSPGETHGLVGTRRYMAPEVLEGAISFNRDAFLRIDMYACGLVLWELCSRCTAVEGEVPEYKLPFEEEVGLHPTPEDMQELVVTDKVRPAIKDSWLRHPGLEGLGSTIEECWDHDAEARLSAYCVQERVAQLGRTVNVSSSNNNNNNNNNINSSQQALIINTNQDLPPVIVHSL